MSESKILTESEIDALENEFREQFVLSHPGFILRLSTLCAIVRQLLEEIKEYEQTDLVPRSRYNAADTEAREARELVKTIADRAKIEIERLEADVARFSKLADERHDQLWEARRQRDDLAAKCAPYLEQLK